MLQQTEIAPEYLTLTNVAAAEFGATVIYCTNEHYATADNLLKEGRGGYSKTAIDGWLSARKRTEGHDYCILKLGAMSSLRGLELDTHGFVGNYPPYASVQACCLPATASLDEVFLHEDWDHLVKKVALEPNKRHFIDMYSDYQYTHIKLHIYPDGGLARFKAYGQPNIDWSAYQTATINLAASNLGAKIVACSDEFFGAATHLLNSQPVAHPKDAWITQRNRLQKSGDWVVVELAQKGSLSAVVMDTQGMSGNCPSHFSLEGLCLLEENFDVLQTDYYTWKPLIEEQELTENTSLLQQLPEPTTALTHVRLRIFPDGGIGRLRLLGQVLL